MPVFRWSHTPTCFHRRLEAEDEERRRRKREKKEKKEKKGKKGKKDKREPRRHTDKEGRSIEENGGGVKRQQRQRSSDTSD